MHLANERCGGDGTAGADHFTGYVWFLVNDQSGAAFLTLFIVGILRGP